MLSFLNDEESGKGYHSVQDVQLLLILNLFMIIIISSSYRGIGADGLLNLAKTSRRVASPKKRVDNSKD